jgi:hypothetical protein
MALPRPIKFELGARRQPNHCDHRGDEKSKIDDQMGLTQLNQALELFLKSSGWGHPMSCVMAITRMQSRCAQRSVRIAMRKIMMIG